MSEAIKIDLMLKKPIFLHLPYSKTLKGLGMKWFSLDKPSPPFTIDRTQVEKDKYINIFITITGNLKFECESGNFVAPPGTFINIPSWIPRKLFIMEPCSYIYIKLDAENEEKSIHHPEVMVSPAETMPEIHQIFEAFYRETNREIPNETATRSYADLIRILLEREFEAHKALNYDSFEFRLQKLWQSIRLAPQNQWDVEIMAKQLFVSPSYLYKLTQQFHGCSPVKMVTKLRLEYAKKLLESPTSDKLDNIGIMSGFANAYCLSNAFRREYGTRPGQYRKSFLAKSL